MDKNGAEARTGFRRRRSGRPARSLRTVPLPKGTKAVRFYALDQKRNALRQLRCVRCHSAEFRSVAQQRDTFVGFICARCGSAFGLHTQRHWPMFGVVDAANARMEDRARVSRHNGA